MKKIIIINLVMFICFFKINAVKTCVADFSYKKDINTIYNIYTKMDYVTTIQLPNDKDVKHIINDNSILKAESDGRFVFIEPLEIGIFTSLSIITEDELLFSFNVIEISEQTNKDIFLVTKAIIKLNNSMIKTIKNKNEKTINKKENEIVKKDILKKKIEEGKRLLIKSLSTSYKIKDKYFNTKSVSDDNNFTYINIKSQFRPVVYLNQNEDELKPLNFVDEDGIIIINHVLEKKERFVLKLGKKISFIWKVFK